MNQENVFMICTTVGACLLILVLGGLILRACNMQEKNFTTCIQAGKDPSVCKQAAMP
jgi:hypothetical protein